VFLEPGDGVAEGLFEQARGVAELAPGRGLRGLAAGFDGV